MGTSVVRCVSRLAIASLAALVAMPPAAAQERRTLQHQGIARDFMLANAPAAGEAPRPALIVLHGRRDPTEPHRTSPALDRLAMAEGFAAVYPAAAEGAWNFVGRTGTLSRAGDRIADDIGFLGRLIDNLTSDRVADPARIYLSGTSSGGFMAYSVLCGLSDKVAAVAPLLASMTESQLAQCKPARQVPVMVIAGTDDRVVPYDGFLREGDRLTSIPETLEHWRRHLQCTGQKIAMMPRREPVEGPVTSLVEWTGCAAGMALRLYRVEGGGHVLPSLAPATPETERRWGRRGRDFETSSEVWRFVSAHRR